MKQQLIGLSAMNRAPVMLVTLQIATEPRGRHTTEYLVMVTLGMVPMAKTEVATAYMFSVTVLAVENSPVSSDDITDGQLWTKRDIPGNLNTNRFQAIAWGNDVNKFYIRRLVSWQ